MTDSSDTPTPAALDGAKVKRRPARGVIYGLILGFGLALIGIGQGMVALGTSGPMVLVIVGVVVGVAWSVFGPAKSAKA